MASVRGVGGVFLKCRDEAALAAWYAEWLGLEVDPETHSVSFPPSSMPAAGFTVLGFFAADTDYFAPSTRDTMLNLAVEDLDGVLERAIEGGAVQAGEPEDYPYGRFAWFVDPEGNKVELWEPLVVGEEDE